MNSNTPYVTLQPIRKLIVFSFLFVAVWYLTWRLGTLNREALVFSWLLYAAELYGFTTTLMHLFMTWRLTVREAPPAPEGRSVDVFITTINEPVSLVRKTLLAVMNMEYPHVTWLLDDGRRPEMEALAKEIGCRYVTRPDNRNAKAGNLNNALLHSQGEFVVIFDADHAPKKAFLARTLGYFDDPEVAFVQTPQDFYNLDSFQHHNHTGGADAWHEQSVFFRVIQRGKDYWNSAFFCGSCAVIRRSALDAIGGFATGTVTEDLHTSLKIHKKGFRSIYHAEPLAFGLAPSEITSFLNQRIRWGQGAMQVWRKEGVFFCRGLSMAQRINYLASSITYFDGWQKGFFYIIPAVVLVTGVMPLVGFGRDFLLHFIPYFILTFWCFEEVGRGYGRSIVIEQFNMARFAAMAWSTLGIFKDKIKFAVTPKGTTPAQRASSYVVPQAMIMAINMLAIPVGGFLYYRYHHLPQSGLIANMVWALVNSGLALTVLRFVSAHSGRHRAEYRFPVPLPAMVRFPDGKEFYGTIDDISSAGFRLYSGHPEECSAGTELTGSIFLPSGKVEFAAVIKTRIMGTDGEEEYVKSIGCSFDRSRSSDLDKLDLFLYGSDVQLYINRLKEVILTPLDLLQNEFGKVSEMQEKETHNWNAVFYRLPGDTEQKVGLITDALGPKGSANLLAFSPIPGATEVEIDIYGRRGVSSVTGRVGGTRKIETQSSPLYNHELFFPRRYMMNGKHWQEIGKKVVVVLGMAALFQAAPASAREVMLLAGAEGGGGGGTSNYYTFVGAVAPILDKGFGTGFVQKYWLDFLGYDYPADNRMVTATGIGVEGSLGYQVGGEHGWSAAYAGARFSQTWLSPDQPDSRVRGTQLRPLVQIEGERNLGKDWKVNGIGRYLFINDGYWTRGRVMYRLYDKVHTGPELIAHGDPDYRAWQAGWFVTGFSPLPNSSIGFKAGVRKVEHADTGAYFGVEFGRVF